MHLLLVHIVFNRVWYILHCRDRLKRPDKQLYVPRPLRRSETESISSVRQQVCDSVSSSKKHINKNCRQNCQLSFIDKSRNQGAFKTELKIDKKSLEKLNSANINVLSSDLDSVTNENVETPKLINVNGQEEQHTENTSNNSEVNLQQTDSELDEKSLLSECKTEIEALNELHMVCKPSNQDELSKCIESDMHSVESNSSKIQSDITKDTEQMIVPLVEDVADSWETMFNDDGECLDPKFLEEVCINLSSFIIYFSPS